MLSHRLPNAVSLGLLVTIVAATTAGCSGSRQMRLPAAASDSSVVAVFDDEVLTLDDFEHEYAKTVGSDVAAAKDSLAAYQDFLQRFVNFRLKVKAAREAGLDSDSSVVAEINAYRSNLARPYLLEQTVLEPIARDIYDKRKEMVDVSHILIRVDQNASPADTLKAYERISALVDSLHNGADFGDLAVRYSEDPSAQRNPNGPGYRGRLGFIEAGQMVAPFEDAAYATGVGQLSPIIRSQFGYHVLKVHARRPAVLPIRISHIMVRGTNGHATDSTALATIKDVRNRLEQGEDFAALAREVSVDQQSAQRGGDLGTIKYMANLPESFRDAAFALKDVGDVSDIVETPYGYHLIKLTGREAPKSFAEAYPDLKSLASRMPRAHAAERKLARNYMDEVGFSADTTLMLDAIRTIPQDSVQSRILEKKLPQAVLADTVITIGDEGFTVEDLANYGSKNGFERVPGYERTVENIFDKFMVDTALNQMASRLEDRDTEFKGIMDDFEDGLILFKLMEDSVWTAAEQDSMALRAYFDAHHDEYQFPDRTRIIGLHSTSDSVLVALSAKLDAGTPLAAAIATIQADTTISLRVDTMYVAEKTNSVYDRALDLEQGQHTEPVKERRGSAVLVNAGVDPARPKTFEEARTEVVSEHQDVLEDRLIQELRSRYHAYLFPDRLTRAFAGMKTQDDPTAASQ